MTICATGAVNLGAQERMPLDWTAQLSFNPAGSTVEMLIDGGLYPMVWVGAPLVSVGGWTQSARTLAMFTGSDIVPLPGDIALQPGRYTATPVVTRGDGSRVESDDPSVVIVR